MFLGDSYTTGRLGQIPELTYAADTARTLGWQVIIGGYRGTGFVAEGHIHKNFADLFTEQLAWRPAPDLVIVSGGHNDRFHSPRAVATRAKELLTTIQHTWAGTRLLLMGPMWGGDPTRAVEDVRDALAGVANERHVPFVDPLRERWITGDRVQGTGNAPMYILHDGIHPTTVGARYISDRFVADLRRLKLATP
jgi:lysophospholipase L1-like esterase